MEKTDFLMQLLSRVRFQARRLCNVSLLPAIYLSSFHTKEETLAKILMRTLLVLTEFVRQCLLCIGNDAQYLTCNLL